MTRTSKDQPAPVPGEPEPPGGRAAERLREFEQARGLGDEEPPEGEGEAEPRHVPDASSPGEGDEDRDEDRDESGRAGDEDDASTPHRTGDDAPLPRGDGDPTPPPDVHTLGRGAD